MTYVGIDACKRGWTVVELAGDDVNIHYLHHLSELQIKVPGAEFVGIDMPIGIPEQGRRSADVAAKQLLGKRRNSVFYVPVRTVLEASTHYEATRVARQLMGQGVSQQSYSLGPKIFEVERWLPSAPCPVREVHPELSFWRLDTDGITASKKTWTGAMQRARALKKVGIDLDRAVGDGGEFGTVDDVLDAAAAAWSARRIFYGLGQCVPDPVDQLPSTTQSAIWY
jgi:predicted RNase H-like nuclease